MGSVLSLWTPFDLERYPATGLVPAPLCGYPPDQQAKYIFGKYRQAERLQ
jgi:hypothetical protein